MEASTESFLQRAHVALQSICRQIKRKEKKKNPLCSWDRVPIGKEGGGDVSIQEDATDDSGNCALSPAGKSQPAVIE